MTERAPPPANEAAAPRVSPAPRVAETRIPKRMTMPRMTMPRMTMPRFAPLALLALLTAIAAPAAAERIELPPSFTPNPTASNGVAGGPQNAATYGSTPLGGCIGAIPNAPQHTLVLPEGMDQLSVTVESGADTTLVVQGPVGWWCNDDDVGLNPGIHGRWAPGEYAIYVGAYNPGESVPYTIRFATTAGGAVPTPVPAPPTPTSPTPPVYPTPVAPPTPVYSTPPAGQMVAPPVAAGGSLAITSDAALAGAASLATGFLPDPHVLSGAAGGPVAAAPLGSTAFGPCAGFVPEQPSHILDLTSSFAFLRVDVSSAADTTLAIYGPSGWLCNDDTLGVNPRIAGAWAPGRYRIWVGTYAPSSPQPYSISFSEWP